MCDTKCERKSRSNELPLVIGGIVVYELAVIIALLILILISLDRDSNTPDTVAEEAIPEE